MKHFKIKIVGFCAILGIIGLLTNSNFLFGFGLITTIIFLFGLPSGI